jgi:hypothetical protein
MNGPSHLPGSTERSRTVVQDRHGETDQCRVGNHRDYRHDLEDRQPGADIFCTGGDRSLIELHRKI